MAAVLAPAWAEAASLTIATAANFRAPFAALASAFERAHLHRARPVFGASGLLATQIRQGADFDVFLSADLARPQALVNDRLTLGPVRTYARGRIAFWTPATNTPPETLPPGRIGIANPQLAPYGQAAIACMQRLGLWQSAAKRLAYGSNVAQVGHFVAARALSGGFVPWALVIDQAAPEQDYWLCPKDAHKPIEQGGVVLGNSSHPLLAETFLRFLISDKTQQQLTGLGYAARD